ncbi:MAG: translocated intimin receptor Tir [Acidobacteriaceae bacterium]|nr:translocated intimin receptor Tir [Acidobacteriaceae bacterium]
MESWRLKAIASDNHFWIPVAVLVIGISLLIFLH